MLMFLKVFKFDENVDLMNNTTSSHCLIPHNLYFPIDRFPIDHRYHGDGFKNLISYV